MPSSGRWISTAGLLAALSLIVGSGEAEAGLGIIIKNPPTLMPVGDPLTEYDFKLLLVANNELLQGDNITLKDIPDFNGTASYVFMSGPIDYSKFFSIVTSVGSSAGLTNIELVLSAGPPASLTNPDPLNNLSIGDLFVVTDVNYAPPPDSPLFNPISYTTMTHFTNPGTPNSGTGITASAAVPEPASVALVGVGLASAGLLARRRRWVWRA